MLGLVLLGPAAPRSQTAALAGDLDNRNAEGAATRFVDVREYLFTGCNTGLRRDTELCCVTASDENVRYVQIYKSNTQGFCSMLDSAENSTKPSLEHSRKRLKQHWDQDSAAEECHDAFTFTFVRDPLDHFISGSSEVAFRFHRNAIKRRDFTTCSMPPHSCYTWAAPSLNAAQRARAFVEDFAWGKLNSPCCDASRETELHAMPQAAFVMDALDGRLGTPVQRIDFLGKLESVQEDWSSVAAAVRGLPAQYVDTRFHNGSDASSGNEFRTAMEDLLRNDSSISAETRDAFCHQLRYDYTCFGYIPDRVCANASPEALEARCPLAIAEGNGGTYVAVDGYSSWYSEQQIQSQHAVIPIADYAGFDFELVAETDLDQDGVAPDLPGVFRTLQVFRAKNDVAQVALVHVGKCAGWTVRDTLRQYGITVWEYHMRQPVLLDLDGQKTAITTRDPLDRVVSAFNWRHPSNNQIHNNPSGPSADPEESGLYHCFDSVRAFAEALDGRNTTTCAELARTMLTGPKSKRGRWSLIGDDTQWYLERVMPQLRQGEIDFTLTHVANLDADVKYAVQWITDTPETQNVELVSVHDDDYPKKYDTGLSRAGRRLLRAALQPEYELLDELEKLAVRHVTGLNFD